ncbi:hypothetical protein FCV25MIE_17340, partial [Fagus crenata]
AQVFHGMEDCIAWQATTGIYEDVQIPWLHKCFMSHSRNFLHRSVYFEKM